MTIPDAPQDRPRDPNTTTRSPRIRDRISDRFLNLFMGVCGLAILASSISTPLLVLHYIHVSDVHHAEQTQSNAAQTKLLNAVIDVTGSHTVFFNGLNTFERTAVTWFNTVDASLAAICAQDNLQCNIPAPFTLPPVQHTTIHSSATTGKNATAVNHK